MRYLCFPYSMTLRHLIEEVRESLKDLSLSDRLFDKSLVCWFILVTEFFPGVIVGAPSKSQVLEYLTDLELKDGDFNSGMLTDEEVAEKWNENKQVFIDNLPVFIFQIKIDTSDYIENSSLVTLIAQLDLAHRQLDATPPKTDCALDLYKFVLRHISPSEWYLNNPGILNIQKVRTCLHSLQSDPTFKGVSQLQFWSSLLGLHLLTSLPEVVPYHEPAKPRPPEESASISQATTKKAFAVEFQKEASLADFKRHVENQFNKWKSTDYYTPYFAFISPSMMGKSRILSEVHRVGLFAFLVCFRREGSVGIPVRTFMIANLLETIATGYNEYGIQKIMFRFIVNCVKKLSLWLQNYSPKKLQNVKSKEQKLASDWYTHQTEEKNGESLFWKSIFNQVEADKVKPEKNDDLVELANTNRDELKEILTQIKIRLGLLGAENTFYNNSCILFEFDESKALIDAKRKDNDQNMFHFMRRSFIIIPENTPGNTGCAPVMAVFTDTTSKVSNFLPSKPWDNSARALTNSTKLMDPFYTIDSFDAFAEPLSRKPSSGTLQSLETEYPKYGRPAFEATVSSGEKDVVVKLVNVVAKKLLGNNKVINPVEAVSILGVLVPLNVHPSYELASELVASRMRICCGINRQRTLVYTSNLPEPIMAIAALKITKELGWKDILAGIKHELGCVTVDIGYKGELGMQIACLIATTKCDPTIGDFPFIKSTPLSDFVQVLVGRDLFSKTFGRQNINKNLVPKQPPVILTKRQSDMEAKIEDPNFISIAKMWVRVHQFVRFNGTVTGKVLLEYFKRGTAILCKQNNPGCDLILPVFFADEGDNTPLNETNMTYLAIQVKLRTTREYGADFINNSLYNLTQKYCDIHDVNEKLKYVTLYTDLGFHSYKSEKLDPTDPRQIAMSYIGYNLKHLNDSITAKALQNLLEYVHLPHENSEIDEESQQVVGRIFQVTYDWDKSESNAKKPKK
jgi:hypothetical protein